MIYQEMQQIKGEKGVTDEMVLEQMTAMPSPSRAIETEKETSLLKQEKSVTERLQQQTDRSLGGYVSKA